MAHVIKDRVKQTCSAPTTTNPFDFTGASTETGFQTFVDALANGDTCLYSAYDSSGNWETGLGTWTEASDELARTTILASSNSGSAETFSGTVTVAITMPARDVESAYKEAKGMIRGLEISRNSTTALDVASGVAAINGKILTYAGATLTSGSTMKDIANSTVTIGADKAYFVFLYDNSGTAEIRIEEADGTGDGADPTWDSDYDYWKAASTGVSARRIGKFWTTGSGNIGIFSASYYGRTVLFTPQRTVLTSGTATTATSVTITPYITGDDETVVYRLALRRTSGTAFLASNIYTDGGTNPAVSIGMDVGATGAAEYRVFASEPNTGTLHYLISGTNVNLSIVLYGFWITR